MEEKKDNLPKRNKNRDSVGSIDFEGSVADGKSNDSNDEDEVGSKEGSVIDEPQLNIVRKTKTTDNAKITKWEMAQKELESVRELRGLKLKWSQWQRSTIRLEFSKRWLLLNEKEAISASSNVVDGVIEFSSQLVKFTLDFINAVNDSVHSAIQNPVGESNLNTPTRSKMSKSAKGIRKYLRKLSLKASQIVGLRQDKSKSGFYTYQTIIKLCTKYINHIPLEGKILYHMNELEAKDQNDFTQKIAESACFKRINKDSVGLSGVVTQIIYSLLVLCSPSSSRSFVTTTAPANLARGGSSEKINETANQGSIENEINTFIYFGHAINALRGSITSILDSEATIQFISGSKSKTRADRAATRADNSKKVGDTKESESEDNIWKADRRSSVKIDWNALDGGKDNKGTKKGLTSSGLPLAGASLNKIIEKVTTDSDQEFMNLIIYTYHTFTTPTELLEKLKQRFQVPDDYVTTGNKLNKSQIKLRVCVFIKYWIQTRIEDFSEKMVANLEDFVEIIVKPEISDVASMLIKELDERLALYKARINHALTLPQINVLSPLSTSLQSEVLMTPVTLIVTSTSMEIARNLTLHEFSSFRDIHVSELLNKAWDNESMQSRCINLMNMLNRSKRLASWVNSLFMCTESPAVRSALLTKFLQVINDLQTLNNFQSLSSVVTGLKQFIAKNNEDVVINIPQSCNQQIAAVDKLLAPEKGYAKHRYLLPVFLTDFDRSALADAEKSGSACIPLMSAVLAEIGEIDEKYPDKESGLINVQKREFLYAYMATFTNYQNNTYPIASSEPLYTFLNQLPYSSVSSTQTVTKSNSKK